MTKKKENPKLLLNKGSGRRSRAGASSTKRPSKTSTKRSGSATSAKQEVSLLDIVQDSEKAHYSAELEKRLNELPKRTKYDPKIHPALARQLCEGYGFTDVELAEVIGISPRTLFGWKVRYPEFGEQVAIGKAQNVGDLKSAAIREALGYFKKETVFMDGKAVTVDKWQRGNASLLKWLLEKWAPEEFAQVEDQMDDREKELGSILGAMMTRMREDALERRRQTITVEATEVTGQSKQAELG